MIRAGRRGLKPSVGPGRKFSLLPHPGPRRNPDRTARKRPARKRCPAAAEKFSNHWKNIFQSLENLRKIFPIIGKPVEIFSNGWKTRRPPGG
jgi:hypothetical protein